MKSPKPTNKVKKARAFAIGSDGEANPVYIVGFSLPTKTKK